MISQTCEDIRVLVAEDEPGARDLISAVFEAGGWRLPTVSSDGVEALSRLSDQQYDILITDLNMPRLGGEELVEQALKKNPDLTVIVLTGNGTIPKAVDLLRDGVYDFLAKPFSVDDLLASLDRAKQRVLHLAEHRGLKQVLDVLLKALESKDPYSTGHSQRVADSCVQLGRKLGLNRTELEFLGYAGLMHDIGKIGVHEEILNKAGALTDEEYEQIKNHVQMSHDILVPVSYLHPCLPAVLHHHERWDGEGYPRGIARAEIPLEARIIAVVDAYDAMISHRSYRRAMSQTEALRRIEAGSGTQFDPLVTETFIAHFDEIVRSDLLEETLT